MSYRWHSSHRHTGPQLEVTMPVSKKVLKAEVCINCETTNFENTASKVCRGPTMVPAPTTTTGGTA